MKIPFTLFAILFISISSFGQQGINYKALIKDDSGNTLVNATNIDIQFTIFEGAALTNPVYLETHTDATTDANGIVILNIGSGTTTDVFTDITWGNDEHWLNVQIDIGAGLVDVSTTQFMAVPYALNVSGLEKITDSINSGTGLPIYGWRLKGRDPEKFGNIGSDAVDLSFSFLASNNGATGNRSFATGYDSEASARTSTAMGYNTTASGVGSTAIGWQSTASNFASTSMGLYTRALGAGSVATGNNTEAHSYVETVIGQRNTLYTPISTSEWNIADRLFVIGNGLPLGDDPRSDALIVLKNGAITAPSFDLTEITDDKSLITKEYADTNLGSSGLEIITENNGVSDNSGFRLIGSNPEHYGPIGLGAVDLSFSNFVSTNYGATSAFAVAMGYFTEASGQGSFAMGTDTKATGENAVAIGFANLASGSNSTALNYYTNASGNYSTALGDNTKANYYGSLAIGSYNTESIAGDGVFLWRAEDPVFEIGNGIDSDNRSNALTILKNGTITAPSLDLSEITDDKALITKEYADTNLGGSGLEQYTDSEGNTGWKLIGEYQSNWVGQNGIDLSTNFGQILPRTGALGSRSLAIGKIATASGTSSIAMGYRTTASGTNSIAMGYQTTAPSYIETVIGINNTDYIPVSATSYSPIDKLFVIGNGQSLTNKNNAVTVLKNGKIGINTSNPKSLFEVAHQDGAPASTNLTNAFSIRNLGGDNNANTSDDESWQIYTEDNGYLLLFRNGLFRGAFNATSGAYGQASDRSVKKDITALENGTLNKVMQLNPVSYLMKDQADTKRNLGLISQEVQELFPSITHYVEAQNILSLSYTELIPILIKALQEQQAIIDGQNAQIDTMSTDNSSLKTTVNNLISRVEKIEANNQ